MPLTMCRRRRRHHHRDSTAYADAAAPAPTSTPTSPPPGRRLGARWRTLPADFVQHKPVIVVEFHSPSLTFVKECVHVDDIEAEARTEKALYGDLPLPFCEARVSYQLPSGGMCVLV